MNIDQKLRNKLYGSMHYTIGFTCLFTDKRCILCCNRHLRFKPVTTSDFKLNWEGSSQTYVR